MNTKKDLPLQSRLHWLYQGLSNVAAMPSSNSLVTPWRCSRMCQQYSRGGRGGGIGSNEEREGGGGGGG